MTTSPLKIGDELIEKAAEAMLKVLLGTETGGTFASPNTIFLAQHCITAALTAILPDLRASILETAAKECDGLRDEIRRHASRQDEAMTKANWLGQETAAVHLGVAIRSLKG